MRGHVRQRGKTWAYVVELERDGSGRRRQQWRSGFATRKEAQTALAEVITTITKQTFVARSSTTLAEYLESWLDGLQLKPASMYSYRKTVRLHILPVLGHVRLQALDPAAVRKAYARLLAGGDGRRPLSGTSVQIAHQVLHRALSQAAAEGLVMRNVAALVKPPRRTTPEMQTWTADQLRTFLVHVSRVDPKLYAMWLLFSTTGMRRGEVAGLKWHDIDFDDARLVVRRSLGFVDGELVVGTPKTTRSRRSLALDPTTLEALRRHRVRQAQERLLLGDAYADMDLVFCNPDGSPFQPSAFGQRFIRRAQEAGLPRIRLHDLRHTYATLALQAGVHPKVVSERLGHAGITITLDLYAHVMPAMERDAATQISALFLPPPGTTSTAI